MSDRFRIHKTDDVGAGAWYLDYTAGFSDDSVGECWDTFAQAVTAFIAATEKRCPLCDKGAVVDTDYGWRCENCGTYDVATGCHPPHYDPSCDA
ncbi:hypothetical protein KXD96_28280 (plasmid) [Mycobacterium sp. SMC-2]|uniref:hypothetical protein n=1 Tax=Mycobacterium sp. SMC-2 TaxID=2857058 RepID=UPI0021B40223|nr:hypothetical protein [Mycobacterium sp. SMC-2]UXA06564.1 hypothetical protein KXD96_27755 [Mycobacterium sp. SMC-2]UXA09656.1 hypothetical protein KXD96_28280 [Mycobacterium sp. SMC-2]